MVMMMMMMMMISIYFYRAWYWSGKGQRDRRADQKFVMNVTGAYRFSWPVADIVRFTNSSTYLLTYLLTEYEAEVKNKKQFATRKRTIVMPTSNGEDFVRKYF